MLVISILKFKEIKCFAQVIQGVFGRTGMPMSLALATEVTAAGKADQTPLELLQELGEYFGQFFAARLSVAPACLGSNCVPWPSRFQHSSLSLALHTHTLASHKG